MRRKKNIESIKLDEYIAVSNYQYIEHLTASQKARAAARTYAIAKRLNVSLVDLETYFLLSMGTALAPLVKPVSLFSFWFIFLNGWKLALNPKQGYMDMLLAISNPFYRLKLCKFSLIVIYIFRLKRCKLKIFDDLDVQLIEVADFMIIELESFASQDIRDKVKFIIEYKLGQMEKYSNRINLQ